MNVEASQEPVNGTELSTGRYILVEFDCSGPCAWLSSDTFVELGGGR